MKLCWRTFPHIGARFRVVAIIRVHCIARVISYWCWIRDKRSNNVRDTINCWNKTWSSSFFNVQVGGRLKQPISELQLRNPTVPKVVYIPLSFVRQASSALQLPQGMFSELSTVLTVHASLPSHLVNVPHSTVSPVLGSVFPKRKRKRCG